MSNPYRYDEGDDHGDNRFAVPGLTDAFQIAGLGPRQGDISHRHNSNARWGSTSLLKPLQSETLISTEMFDSNIPMAYQLRFSLTANGVFIPAIPSGSDGALLTIRKSIDLKAGAADESVSLFAGNPQPSCTVICRQLIVSMKNLAGEGGTNLYVHAAACPVSMVDCKDTFGNINGYSRITQQEFIQTQATTPILALLPNPQRSQFFVQNTSVDSDVIIQWGINAAFGPPPVGVFILPANSVGIYESQIGAWTGAVTISFSNGAGNGGALITEGSF